MTVRNASLVIKNFKLMSGAVSDIDLRYWDMSIILCQCDRLARGLPSLQERNRDDRTKKIPIPISTDPGKPSHSASFRFVVNYITIPDTTSPASAPTNSR
jgi:hypothetical protein